MSNLTQPIPVYVTRKNADGMIASYTVSAWVALAVMIFGGFAAVLWSIIALAYGIITIVNAVGSLL